jgi:hypothetical protein
MSEPTITLNALDVDELRDLFACHVEHLSELVYGGELEEAMGDAYFLVEIADRITELELENR